MAIDELDARVRHARVSPEGMAAMAHTELQEEKLGRLVRGYPPEERRAFWIGVLLRDGAISVEQALANRTAAPLRPRRADPPRWWRWSNVSAVCAGGRSRSRGGVGGRGHGVITAEAATDE
jgi:hypothetical protein